MRLRRPAVAATALGLAGALLPSTSATAATPDRVFAYSDDVTVHRPDGSTYQCTVFARFVWHLGEDRPDDDSLFASTGIQIDGSDAFECEFGVHNVVTLHWSADGSNNSSDYSYTAEGQKNQDIYAPPTVSSGGGSFYQNPSSEHRWVFPNCASDCEFTHTLNPK